MVDMTKDKQHRHRAWWKMDNNVYLVQLPSYLVPRSAEDDCAGTFTTGSREADRIMAGAEQKVWLTLVQLINIYCRGGAFSFINPQTDIVKIHQILQDHIDDFEIAESKYRTGLYIEDEEVVNRRRRDMIDIDEFAREIYKRAYRKELPKDSPFRGLEKFLTPFEKFDSILKNIPAHQDIPAYQSVANKVDYSALKSRKRHAKR